MQQKRIIAISIATVPSRIGLLKPTLTSLLEGELVPDQILVVHPEFCKWANSGYDIPEFFEDREFCGDIVKRVVSPVDWGPGTKMLGALDHVPHESYLVLADDDVIYHRSFLNGLIRAQSSDHTKSYSYFAYRRHGLTVGQGCDGYSFWRPNLDLVKPFVEKYVSETTLLYHDDFWIAYYLFRRNIEVRKLTVPDGLHTIYEQITPNNVLSSHTDGEFERERIIFDNFRRLIAEDQPTRSQLLKIRSLAAYDHLRALPQRFATRIAVWSGRQAFTDGYSRKRQ